MEWKTSNSPLNRQTNFSWLEHFVVDDFSVFSSGTETGFERVLNVQNQTYTSTVLKNGFKYKPNTYFP